VIDQQDINRFYNLQRKSTDSTFKLQISDGTTYNKAGKVLTIDRGVNNQTGTVTVRIQFPNDQDVLKDGMSCVLKVLNEQSGNRILIPYKAVIEQMGEFFVFVAKDTVAKQFKVALGPRIGADVVVMNGVQQGDKVITEGFQKLRDGAKITLGIPAEKGQTAQQGK
jgi:membrane fusion protein (multidrug efflux system)